MKIQYLGVVNRDERVKMIRAIFYCPKYISNTCILINTYFMINEENILFVQFEHEATICHLDNCDFCI